MDIFCACPFAVAALGWEPAPGRRSLSVTVKATFVLVPGTSVIAALQDPVRVDEAPGATAPDLVPFKPRADVLFSGHAHAAGGALTDSLLARARVGTFRKSLSINGDRTWVPSFDGLRPSVAVPFRRMPLSYDRAVRTGENLAGVDISQGAEPNRPLANIAAIADQGGETPGLGPIPFGWRALRYGFSDASLLWASRAGLMPGPPPPGFDFRVFNAAPAEQQVDDLPPGTEVLLENLHPEHPRLETRLPALRVKLFRRAPRADRAAEVPVRCDTLWIDTDRGLAIALWRGAVLVDSLDDDAVGRLVVTAEAEGESIGPDDVDRMLARFTPEVTYVDAASMLGRSPAEAPAIADPIPVPEGILEPLEAPLLASLEAPLDVGDEASLEAHVESLDDAPSVERTTLAPPPPSEAPPALPFRAPAWSEPDDSEVTPPRGYPSISRLRTMPPPLPTEADLVTPASDWAAWQGSAEHAAPAVTDGDYCAVKMEAWVTGAPLAAVLERRGMDEPAFRAHDAAQLEALEREAAEGRSDHAAALLDGLASTPRE